LYDRLFDKPNPEDDKDEPDFTGHLNPNSLEALTGGRVEPSLADAEPESRYQFERLGYFCVDRKDSSANRLVFNRTVPLRDTWAKIRKAQGM
jgi:glutaminyl-tRNA synthetase